MKIFKYPLKVMDAQVVMLPEGARILTVQMQRDEMQLWALVNPRQPASPRTIAIVGTGHLMPSAPSVEFAYITTVQMEDGNLAWHVFEAKQ